MLSFVKRLTRSSRGKMRSCKVCGLNNRRKIMWDDFLYNVIYWCRFIVAIVLVLLLVGVFT